MAPEFVFFFSCSVFTPLFVLKDSRGFYNMQKIVLFSVSCPLAYYRAQFDSSFRGQFKLALNDCYWEEKIPDPKVLTLKWFWDIFK